MNLSSWFQNASVSAAEVRAEIWRLGGRHFGQPLEGALEELEGQDISTHQTLLLRACVRELRSR